MKTNNYSFSIRQYQEKGKMFDTGWNVNLFGHRSAFGFLVSKIDYPKVR